MKCILMDKFQYDSHWDEEHKATKITVTYDNKYRAISYLEPYPSFWNSDADPIKETIKLLKNKIIRRIEQDNKET